MNKPIFIFGFCAFALVVLFDIITKTNTENHFQASKFVTFADFLMAKIEMVLMTKYKNNALALLNHRLLLLKVCNLFSNRLLCCPILASN